MTYDPNIKVYYGTNGSSSDRLEPAPLISLNTEPVYANDSVIGYLYTVSFSGNATALKLSSAADTNKYGVASVSSAVENVRNIFSLNGGNLYVVNKDGDVILEGRGGTVRSTSFDESSNNWVNFAPYKIDVEFSEVIINGCSVSQSISCTDSSLNSDSFSNNLVDISKYKIRSFNDGWTFNLSDQIHNTYGNFNNQHFDVEYKISATGKHFFKEDGKLLPAWEQAKNFVQDRLIEQVTALIPNILKRHGIDGCAASTDLNDIHDTGTPGSLTGMTSDYDIYNESVSCDTGEAEGSFSATYKAILKYGGDIIHTFSCSRSVTDDNKSNNVSVSVQGKIDGLIPGGLIKSANTLNLPNNGKIFIASDSSITKYQKALAYGTSQIYNAYDLRSGFKSLFGISSAFAASHMISHDYTTGSISYTTEYNTETDIRGNSGYRNITVTKEESTPLVVEFVIPGRSGGPIIQYLGAYSPRKVSINIEGVVPVKCCNSLDLQQAVFDKCASGKIDLDIPENLDDNLRSAGFKLISRQETNNPVDGSYSITYSYIGCNE